MTDVRFIGSGTENFKYETSDAVAMRARVEATAQPYDINIQTRNEGGSWQKAIEDPITITSTDENIISTSNVLEEARVQITNNAGQSLSATVKLDQKSGTDGLFEFLSETPDRLNRRIPLSFYNGKKVGVSQSEQADSLSAEDGGFGSLSTKEVNRAYSASSYGTIQDAIDAVPAGGQNYLGYVTIEPDRWTENIDISKNTSYEGKGTNSTYIDGPDGDHTVDISVDDAVFERAWVDSRGNGAGSGSWDAFHISASETRLERLEIDKTDRNAIYISGDHPTISDVQMLCKGDIVLDGTSGGQLSDIQCKSNGTVVIKSTSEHVTADSINTFGSDPIDVSGSKCYVTANCDSANSTAIDISGNNNFVKASIFGTNATSVKVSGKSNTLLLNIFGTAVNGVTPLEVSNNFNEIYINTDGTFTLTAGAESNKIHGFVDEAFTDNGTGNVTSGVDVR